jgi:hypothetical protein
MLASSGHLWLSEGLSEFTSAERDLCGCGQPRFSMHKSAPATHVSLLYIPLEVSHPQQGRKGWNDVFPFPRYILKSPQS